MSVTLKSAILALAFCALLSLQMTALASDFTRPVYARPATTASGFLMEGFFETFDGLTMQEAHELEGWTAGLDFTIPINRTMQLRFLLPARTEADGVFVDTEEEVEIEGWGGTFDFATLYFEHQLVGIDNGPDRLAWFGGFGYRTGVLKTGTPDRYNHQGRSLHLGVRYDRVLDRAGMLFLDTEFRFYDPSDDLNPGDLIDDSFWLATVTAAWLAAPLGAFTPGVELMADIAENYTAASIAPELVISAGQTLDLKLAVPVGLTSDAPDWGAQFRLTLSF
jgi:hypothetical protein